MLNERRMKNTLDGELNKRLRTNNLPDKVKKSLLKEYETSMKYICKKSVINTLTSLHIETSETFNAYFFLTFSRRITRTRPIECHILNAF